MKGLSVWIASLSAQQFAKGGDAHLAAEHGPNPRRHRLTWCCPPGRDLWLQVSWAKAELLAAPGWSEALPTPGLLALQPQSWAQPSWLRTPPLRPFGVLTASSQLTFQGKGCWSTRR